MAEQSKVCSAGGQDSVPHAYGRRAYIRRVAQHQTERKIP
jgi:hypothetical protein